MGRLDIPDPRSVRNSPSPDAGGQYDISRSLLARRYRELHRADRILGLRRAIRWLLVGALFIIAGRSVYRAAGEKYGYLEPEKPPPATAADASLLDPDSDSEQGRAAPRP